MFQLAGGKKKVDRLSFKLVQEHCEHKFDIVRAVHFTGSRHYGITLEDDWSTVKEVVNGSQADEQGVRPGCKIFKVESNGAILTKGFQKFFNDVSQDCTVMFGDTSEIMGLPGKPITTQEEESNCLNVNIRLLVTRLYNCSIPDETFEADLFVELMWLAPWDVPTWKDYMRSIENWKGYKDLLEQLRLADWNKPDTQPFRRPMNREEEVYYSERVVQSFDRQVDLDSSMGISCFKPTWKPRIIFTNMKTKSYDEMNFGSDAFSMVNIGNQWYTVWRRNIVNAVFFESYDLANFPYDIQELTINVLCTHPKTRVKLLNHKCYRSSCIVLTNHILLPEWTYLGMRCSVGSDKSGRFSNFKFEAEVRRMPDYFIKSGQFVFTSITIVSFLVFGIPAEHEYIGERLSYGGTMLLTTIAFKWLLSEKMPNLPYDTYLDDYSQWGFYIQILIMLSNGAMSFVRVYDDDEEMDTSMLQLYDSICFSCIFSVWAVYQVYAYTIRVPRVIKEESQRLVGMTDAKHEKVDRNYLMKITGMKKKISCLGSPRIVSPKRSRSISGSDAGAYMVFDKDETYAAKKETAFSNFDFVDVEYLSDEYLSSEEIKVVPEILRHSESCS